MTLLPMTNEEIGLPRQPYRDFLEVTKKRCYPREGGDPVAPIRHLDVMSKNSNNQY